MHEVIERYDEFCFIQSKNGEFIVTKKLILLVFEEDISVLEQEQVDRFNLQEHEDEVEKRYSESGVQPK